MNTESERQQRLERLLGGTLRDLPLRSAPASLESRVLAQLQHRAAQPWRHRSFANWPSLVRAAYVLISCGLMGLAFFGGTWAVAALRMLQDSGHVFAWARQAMAVAGAAANLAASLARAVPPAWLNGGLAAGALLYAVLFGLSAAAYRVLYLQARNCGGTR